MRAWILWIVSVVFIFPELVNAGAVLTYHGRIIDQQGRPLEGNVTFKIRVYSPTPGKCLLYEESRNLQLNAAAQGVFVIPIGDGDGQRSGDDPGLTMENIFANNGKTIPNLTCNTTDAYTSQPLDQRLMVVSYDDHTGFGWDHLPPMALNYVPFSVNSHDSQNIGGTPAASVLRVHGGAASPMSVANFTELMSLLNGTSNQYEKRGHLNGSSIPIMGAGQTLGWNGTNWSAMTPLTAATEQDPSVKSFAKNDLPICGSGAFLQSDASGHLVCLPVAGATGGTVKSVTAGAGLKTDQAGGAAITESGELSVDVGVNAGQIVQLETGGKLPAVDGSQLTNLNAAAATVAEGLSNTASVNTTGAIAAAQLTSTGTITAAGTITSTNGDIIANNGNIQTNKAITAKDGLFLYDQKTPSPGSVGLKAPADIPQSYILKLPTSLPAAGTTRVLASDDAGNMSWAAQSAGSVVSVTADAPLSVNSSTPGSPKISLQKSDASHDGYLSKTDWSTFNNKQVAGSYITNLTGDVSSSSYASGSVSTSVDKIKGVPVMTAIAGDDQKFMKFVNGSGWQPHYAKLSELKNAMGTAAAFDVGIAGCTSSQTLVWTSLTDQFKCQDISLPVDKVSGLAAVATSGNYSDLSNLPVIPTCGLNQYLTYNGTSYTCASVSAESLDVAVTIDKITNAATKYFDYKPNNVACAANQTLKYSAGTGWICANMPTGTVTSVTATGPLSSSGGATPQISLSQATASSSGFLSAADWNIFNNAATGSIAASRMPALSGDVSSAAGSTAVTLNTVSLEKGGTGLTTAGAAHQFLSVNAAGSALEYKTLQAGNGIAITPGSGSLNIAVSGNLGGIQAGVTLVATEGVGCSNVGQLATDSDGDLLVCDLAPTILEGSSCAFSGAGSLTFDEGGSLYVCLN